jgi:hypothetical protein
MEHLRWGAAMNALVIASKTNLMERVVKYMVGDKPEKLGIVVSVLYRKHSEWVAYNMGVVGIGGGTITVAANQCIAKLVCSKAAA